MINPVAHPFEVSFTLVTDCMWGTKARTLMDETLGVFPAKPSPTFTECTALLERLHELHPDATFTAAASGYELVIDRGGRVKVTRWNGEAT